MANRIYKIIRPSNKIDLSGGVQAAVSRLLQRKNEVHRAKNAVFNKSIGSANRRDGYEQVGYTIQDGNDGLGLHVYRYNDNNKIMVGINSADNSTATVRYLDVAGYWTTLLSDANPNTRFAFLDLLGQCFITGHTPGSNFYYPMTSVDSTLTTNLTRNVYQAPRSKFITEFQNSIVALNCQVNGVRYPDRFYISSPTIGAITFVQGDQTGLFQQLLVNSVRYLKVGMTVDIFSAGTNSLIQTLTIITVDKNHGIISFAPTQIAVKNNDEIWLTGTKGSLSVLWNTDYPTPESAEWKRIPPGVDSNSALTAYGKNNSRLLIFSRNSTWKFDGANLVNISETVGCIADQTVANVAGWTMWLHTTGVWGYNDSTGQLKLLSRSMNPYIAAMNLTSAAKASAVVVNRVYKLSIGEVADLGASTTSTSTSSTSTSSTSSSTSSTSTSSTSTSSTSTSTTTAAPTTTSTSSTSTSSTSTSSTSLSTSSTSQSTSTSTSSTSTSTIASTKQVLRLVYDFDSNIWWTEFHRREQRFQITHTMSGYQKPYFLDETGRLFRDETGNLDHHDTIPFEVEIGRDDQGTRILKSYTGLVVESEKAQGGIMLVSVDNGNWHDIGQITEDVQVFDNGLRFRGRDINYKIVHNVAGDGPSLDGVTTYFSLEETKVG